MTLIGHKRIHAYIYVYVSSIYCYINVIRKIYILPQYLYLSITSIYLKGAIYFQKNIPVKNFVLPLKNIVALTFYEKVYFIKNIFGEKNCRVF